MKSFKELCEAINLLDFALWQGYTVVKASSTRRNPVLRGPEGDVIVLKNTEHNDTARYFNATEGQNTTDRGNLIEFTRHRVGSLFPAEEGHSVYHTVNKVLHQYLNIPLEERTFSQLFTAGDKRPFDVRLYDLKPVLPGNSYLHGRGIGDRITDAPAFKGRIYTNLYNGVEHVSFPFYGGDNRTIIGLNFRSADTNKNAASSNRASGIWTSNLPRQVARIVIAESPIDCLSYAALQAGQGRANAADDTLYVATFGRPSLEHGETLNAILQKARAAGKLTTGLQLITAFDNDYSGQLFSVNEANYVSDGSYVVRAGINFRTKEIEVHIWDGGLLTDSERVMLGLRPDAPAARTLYGLPAQSNSPLFEESARVFVETLKKTTGEEMIRVAQLPKGLLVKADAIPENARALNRAFHAAFEKSQVLKVKPAIPRRKDFNEDLTAAQAVMQRVAQPKSKTNPKARRI